MSILIVEDEAELRLSTEELLRLSGYDVRSAEHGQQALEMLRAGPAPKLILVDLMMPDMDGWEFLRRLHEDADAKHHGHIPVCIVSGSENSARQTAQAYGAEVMPKPLDPQRVLAAARKYCEAGSTGERRDRSTAAAIGN